MSADGPGADYIPGSLYNPDKLELDLFSDGGWNITSENKKQLYNLLVSAMNSKSTYINVSKYRIPVTVTDTAVTADEEFSDLYYSAVYNNPQSGYLKTGFSYSYSSTGYMTSLRPGYLSDYDEEAYMFAADFALSMCVSPDMTEWEKLLSIHDYLTDNIVYTISGDWEVYTPYGALVNGRAVCQGYSLAYKLLCDRAGLNVSYAVDKQHNHIWNVAELDGKYYHIDVTWDDPVYNNDTDRSLHATFHDYFLLSDATNLAIRGYTERTWVNYFGDCTDASMENSIITKANIPLVWKDGAFWGRDVSYVNDENGDRFAYNGKLCKISDGKLIRVYEEDFAPFDELDYTFGYVADGVLAIKGIPDSDAMLYSATFNDDGDLEWAGISNCSFDSKGRSVIRGVEGNRQLLWGSSQKPVAYPRNN